jgi:hypothetical protein
MSLIVRPFRGAPGRLAAIIVLGVVLTACQALEGATPKPTRAGFQGVAVELATRGVEITGMVSGDAGCDDTTLAPTAVSIRASGLDQPGPLTLYLYSFKNQDAYQRLRTAIDACAQSYVTDPDTYESVDASPYVVTGQGPWGPQFEAAIRAALDTAVPKP